MLFVVDGLRPDSITAEDTPTLHRLRGAVFHLLFELAHPRADGTTHLLRDPLELIEKIALLIPPPRFHTLRCHGVRGPCAGWRSAVKREDGARAEPSPGRWVRRVSVLWGRRCCAGSSPWTSFSARAAAGAGGSWASTPAASACGAGSRGSGSTGRCHRR
jgi:hypothetical protein